MYLYLNTVLTKVFAIVFVFGKFIAFVFVFKYYAMYLDPSLLLAMSYVAFIISILPYPTMCTQTTNTLCDVIV